ncbi:acyltransferase [Psychrobacter pacificensis]|uniref:acyltransferase n=1 Tax=Psychrobacter pacificensis TaxID=112002 RepID=UPI003D06D9E6
MAHYSEEELKHLGLKSYGNNVLISKDARIYSPHKVSIGNDVRIDDFCILSGEVSIENNVHLAPGVQLAAGSGVIIIKDFAGIAFNTVLTASSDDYSGASLTGPTVPDTYKKTKSIGEIIIGRHVIIGASCFVMPNVVIGDGSAVGAMSFVSKSLESWGVYFGIPVKRIKGRSKEILKLEKDYRESY